MAVIQIRIQLTPQEANDFLDSYMIDKMPDGAHQRLTTEWICVFEILTEEDEFGCNDVHIVTRGEYSYYAEQDHIDFLIG